MLRQTSRLVLALVGVAGTIAFAASNSALAASPGDALRSLGLVGTWSPNCNVPAGAFGAIRSVYEVGDDGRATFTSTFTMPRLNDAQAGSVYQIDDASIVSDTQIKLIARVVKQTCPGCQSTSPPNPAQRQMIVEKVGGQIRIVDNRLLDGTGVAIAGGVISMTGKPAALESKCAAVSTAAATAENTQNPASGAPAPHNTDSPPSPPPPPPIPVGPPLMSPTAYLLARLTPKMTLDAYLKRMDGEIRMADADANGEISTADAVLLGQIISANFRAIFLAQILPADLDGDGAITEDEFRRWWRYREYSSQARPPAGKTVDEVIEDKVHEFMAADTDHDGRVTFAELLNYAKSFPDIRVFGGQAAYQLLALAPDGKSVLTRADLEAIAEKLFHEVDTDGDGVVSADELQSYRASHPTNGAH